MSRLTGAQVARSNTPGLGARVPVLAAFVALSVLTTMTVVNEVEKQSPGRTAPAAAPTDPGFESDPSDRTPMAGLIPWAGQSEWPLAPEAPVEEPTLPSNPLLSQGPIDWPGLSVDPTDLGERRGTDSGKGRDKATPNDPKPSGPADHTETGEPVSPTDPGATDAGPSDGDSSPGDQSSGEPSDGPSDGGGTEGGTGGDTTGGETTDGSTGGEPSGGGTTGGDPQAELMPQTETPPPALVNDAGIGEISNTTDATGVSSLGVPITATSSALAGTVATVTLTLSAAADPVIVKSAGGAAWNCQGPAGNPIVNGQDATFASGVTITCKHVYVSEDPAPTLSLRVAAEGLHGKAAISGPGTDPNPANDARDF